MDGRRSRGIATDSAVRTRSQRNNGKKNSIIVAELKSGVLSSAASEEESSNDDHTTSSFVSHLNIPKKLPTVGNNNNNKRGRPRRRGAGHGRGKGDKKKGDGDGDDTDDETTGKGRPRKSSVYSKIACFSFPVTDKDEEDVKCSFCETTMTLREFRIHNMQTHSNVATTSDDTTLLEHKFYERRLKELAKFSKVTRFRCPITGCSSTYTSTLGLAYHLEVCGKTKEQIELILSECEICHKKYTFASFVSHKKIHQRKNAEELAPIRYEPEIPKLDGKIIRKSAIKAKEMLQKGDNEDDDQLEETTKKLKHKRKIKGQDQDYHLPDNAFDIELQSQTEDDDEDEDSSVKRDVLMGPKPKKVPKVIKSDKKRNATNTTPIAKSADFPTSASEFINSKQNFESHMFWNRRKRVIADCLSSFDESPWIEINDKDEQIYLQKYLPSQTKSVQYKTIFKSSKKTVANDFHQLSWFDGEIIDDVDGNLVFNAGGPVLDLSWHPSGKLLAVSTATSLHEDIDYKIQRKGKSSIQIYSHTYKKILNSNQVINSLIPKLVICSEFGYATHIQWSSFHPKCWDNFDINEATFVSKNASSRIGHLACAFEDATIRIYIFTLADLFKNGNFQIGNNSTSNKIPAYKKVPEICLKVDADTYCNTGQICSFEWHEDNKYLIAGYCNGLVAVFDMSTTSLLLLDDEVEDGQNIDVISPFWSFQGHSAAVIGLSFDPMAPRYFVTASKDRYVKIWDLNMRKEVEYRKVGLVQNICWIRGWINIAVAVDAAVSNSSSQLNFVRFYQIGTNLAVPTCAEFSDVTSLSFHEGITLQASETGSITATYFDNFWREFDFGRNKKKHNVVSMCKLSLDETSFEPIKKEAYENAEGPLEIKSEEPRIILTFLSDRIRSTCPDPNPQFFEDYIRFLPYFRINKLCWSPLGNFVAAGYRNGLVTIMPASFDSLYG